jgi:hypothetical protein
MASTYSDLKIELIGTGDQTGTWGTTTNNNFSIALSEAITGSADVAFSSADVTVTLTDTNAAQTARNLRLNLTGTSGGARQLILGSGCQIEKLYLVNNGLADAVTIKNTSGTGIAVPAGKSMFVYNNGTNVVDATTYLSSLTLGTALPITSGGTGSTSTTYVNLTTNVTGTLPIANGGTGSTSTAYANLTTNVTGTLPIANGGTGATTLTANNVILGNGTSAPLFVAPGTAGNILTSDGTTWASTTPAAAGDVTTNTVQTITGTKTFTGTSSTLAMILNDAAEVVTVSATAATGTINYDVTTQSVLYYTTDASANWTVNFRASSGTSLNTIMSTGQSVTVAFLVTQGAVAYYNSAVQVDGSSVTPEWQGGTAPAAGNASSVDVYMYTIVKTGSATFTVFASQTRFA